MYRSSLQSGMLGKGAGSETSAALIRCCLHPGVHVFTLLMLEASAQDLDRLTTTIQYSRVSCMYVICFGVTAAANVHLLLLASKLSWMIRASNKNTNGAMSLRTVALLLRHATSTAQLRRPYNCQVQQAAGHNVVERVAALHVLQELYMFTLRQFLLLAQTQPPATPQ